MAELWPLILPNILIYFIKINSTWYVPLLNNIFSAIYILISLKMRIRWPKNFKSTKVTISRFAIIRQLESFKMHLLPCFFDTFVLSCANFIAPASNKLPSLANLLVEILLQTIIYQVSYRKSGYDAYLLILNEFW